MAAAVRNATNRRSASTGSTPPRTSNSSRIYLPSALLTLIDTIVARESGDVTSRADFIKRALETYLAATIGTEVDQSHFERTERTELAITLDPVYEQLIALDAKIDTTQGVEQAVRSVVYDELNIQPTKEPIEVKTFDQYRFVIDTLVEAESCPCESRGEIAQAALERHMHTAV